LSIALITKTPNFKLLLTPATPVPSSAGGCVFAVDPNLPANEAELFWLPSQRASAVILEATPTPNGEGLRFTPSSWTGVRAHRHAGDGEHIILGTVFDQHQLWLPDPPPTGHALAAIIPLDDLATGRTAATERFLRHVKGRRLPPTPGPNPRFVDTLRALDGHLNGASYRAIAQCIFGPARVAAEPWRTSPLRDATIRLVRTGIALMRGGYRKFLRK